MNYRIEIREPDGKVVYIAESDLTPSGFVRLVEKINGIEIEGQAVVCPKFRDWVPLGSLGK